MLVAVMVAVVAAMAPPSVEAAVGASEAITIEPALMALEVEPGQTVTFDVLVKNQTSQDAELSIAAWDLARRSGGAESLEFSGAGTAPRGAGGWLRPVPDAWRASTGTEQRVRVTARVPSDAGAGGHFAALVVRARAAAGSGDGLDLSAETSVVVLFTVRGDFVRRLDVKVEPKRTWNWRGGTLEWEVELHNEGDIHENVSGSVWVDGLVGGSRRLALEPGILLPDERRKQRVRLEVRDAPDVLAARVRVHRDDETPARAVATRAWVLPWWMLVALVVAVALVIRRVRARTDTFGDELDEHAHPPRA